MEFFYKIDQVKEIALSYLFTRKNKHSNLQKKSNIILSVFVAKYFIDFFFTHVTFNVLSMLHQVFIAGFRAAAPREELVTPPPQQQQQHRPSPSKSTTTTTTRNRASEALKKGRSGALSQRGGKGAKEEVRQFDVFGRSKTRIAGTIRFKNIHKKNPSQRKAKSRPISAGLTVGRASSASKFSADGSSADELSAGELTVRSSIGRSSADKSSTGSSSADRLSVGISAGKSGRLQPQIALVPNLAPSATFESSLRQTASSNSFQHQQAESFGASSQILNPNTFPNLSKSFEAPGTKSSKSSTKPQSGLISKRKGAATTSSKLSRNQIPSGFGPSEIRNKSLFFFFYHQLIELINDCLFIPA